MSETTLILCSAMPDALAYAREALNRGEKIVASSSLAYDDSARQYPVWEYLPSVYEEEFLAALQILSRQVKCFALTCGVQRMLCKKIRLR